MGTISVSSVLAILFIHWIADGLLQTDKMAQGKSKNWYDLLDHTATYSICFCVLMLFVWSIDHWGMTVTPKDCLLFLAKFTLITFFFHTFTDYFTSRINARLWADKKVHWFFVSILFDQLLHFAQLIITYEQLTK